MKLRINFETAVIAIICMMVCEKSYQNANIDPIEKLKINADLQNSVHKNDRNNKPDVPDTFQLDGIRQVGKYNVQLSTKKDFGHLAISNFPVYNAWYYWQNYPAE
jgi:hypothetical protein